MGLEPLDEAIAHEVTVCKSKLYIKGFFFLKILCYTFLICLLSHFRNVNDEENKGKDVSEGKCPETQPQDQPEIQTQGRPTAGDKRKSLPKNLDLEGLPSHRDKRVKHSSSKVVKFKPP